MPPRAWLLRIRDIHNAVSKILTHTETLSESSFTNNEWTIDAVLRNLAVIGEAAHHVPDEIVKRHAEMPWDEMRDMRNIVIHEYFGVDLGIVWKTIQDDLPLLLTQIERLLQDLEDQNQ